MWNSQIHECLAGFVIFHFSFTSIKQHDAALVLLWNIHANGDNMLGNNTNMITKNTEILSQVSKEIGSEGNMDKTKYSRTLT